MGIDWDPRAKAEGFKAFYRRLHEEQPGVAEWKRGVELTQRWLALIVEPRPDRMRVRALLADFEEGEYGMGSTWLEMSAAARAWARSVVS